MLVLGLELRENKVNPAWPAQGLLQIITANQVLKTKEKALPNPTTRAKNMLHFP